MAGIAIISHPLTVAALLRPVIQAIAVTTGNPLTGYVLSLLRAIGLSAGNVAIYKTIIAHGNSKAEKAKQDFLVFQASNHSWSRIFPPVHYRFVNPTLASFTKAIVITSLGLGLIGLVYYYRNRKDIQSRLLSKTKYKPRVEPGNIRVTFNELPSNGARVLKDHTHPEAAADRTGASLFIDRLARCLGCSEFMVQMSKSDIRQGRQGSRAYYWSQDLTIEPRPIVLPENPLVAFVDVDEYIDMPSFLAANPHPTVIYTFQPDQVAKVANNYSYTFDKDNQVKYTVTGGGGYTHPVWNYSSDHFMVTSTFLGFPYRRVSYTCDRRSTGSDRQIIMLSPVGTWYGFGALFHWLWIQGKTLERLKPVTGTGYLRMQTNSLEGVKVSTGRVDNYNSSTIPVATDDTIAVIARTSSYDLTMPQVLSFVDGNREAAAALLDYHRAAVGVEKRPQVCPVPQSTRRYQFDPRSYDPSAKPSMVGFMSPLVHGAFVPDQTVGNEVQCVEGRIEKIRPKELPLTPFLVDCMDEFVKLLIPTPYLLDPVDYDEVLSRQKRPTQRRILANSECGLPDRIINMFGKKEAYTNVKDPRAISTINGVDKREYSRFMYSFESVMKTQPWYAFSLTPIKISSRVASVCESCESHTTNSDFKRFDGHGSNMMRELERIALIRAFRAIHHSEIMRLHKGQFNLKAFATFGTAYLSGFSRASGSPETSLFNTLVNAFTAYLGFRMSKDANGCFYTPEEAFSKLGIYGGDDGLTADLDGKVYQKAASCIGQELEVEPIRRGHGGVKFLARIYSPCVWYGDVNSCCDVPRQISKFHVTIKLPPNVTPSMKLLEKVRSFALSDINTPILGDLCRKVQSLHGTIEKNIYTEAVSSWLSSYEADVQYPNMKASWMISYVDTVMPEFEYKKFLAWVDSVTSLEAILVAPMFMAPVVAVSKEPVVVDDQVIPHGTKIPCKAPRGAPSLQNTTTPATTIISKTTTISNSVANHALGTPARHSNKAPISPSNDSKPISAHAVAFGLAPIVKRLTTVSGTVAAASGSGGCGGGGGSGTSPSSGLSYDEKEDEDIVDDVESDVTDEVGPFLADVKPTVRFKGKDVAATWREKSVPASGPQS